MTTQAVSERKSPWIMSPSIDLIVGCGAWSLPLLILPYLVGGNGQNRVLGFYPLAMLVNYPHYMATIYRTYRTRDFERYRTVSVYFTLLLIALLIAAHEFYGLVPLLTTNLTPPAPAQPVELQTAQARIHVLSTHQSQ